MQFSITHIVRKGLILPLSDDVVFHEFIDIVGRMDHDMYALAEFGSAALSDNDA